MPPARKNDPHHGSPEARGREQYTPQFGRTIPNCESRFPPGGHFRSALPARRGLAVALEPVEHTPPSLFRRQRAVALAVVGVEAVRGPREDDDLRGAPGR